MLDKTNHQFFPLSLNQKNIWNLEQAYPGTPMNHISTTIRIEGRIHLGLLDKSIHLVLNTDVSLRTRICLQDGEPVQYQVPYEREPFLIYDFSKTDKEGILNWENAVARETMPILDSPLYRFVLFKSGDSSGGVLLKLHHLISDGWSQVLVCNRIAETYLALLSDREPELDDAPDYRLYVGEEEVYLHSQAYKRDQEYWEKVFQKGGSPAVLKPAGSAVLSPVGRRVSFVLPETLSHAVDRFCIEHRVAPFTVFYMALAIYFRRMGGERRSIIGVPVVNRTTFQFKQSTGMFVSTLPFFCELDERWSLEEFLDHMQEEWYELLRHQRFPFAQMDQFREGKDRENALFQIAFSYQDSRIVENRGTSVTFSGRWHYSGYQAEQLCIHLSNLGSTRRYSVDYDYLTQLFAQEEIQKFHEILICILAEALKEPKKPVRSLHILRAKETEQVLYRFNDTSRYLPKKSLREAFTEICTEAADRAALIYQGRRIRYREFYEKAREISIVLQKYELKAGGLTAVLLPKSFLLYEVIGAAMLTGCGWLLLPLDLPEKRIRKILKKSGAAVLITAQEYLAGELEHLKEETWIITLEENALWAEAASVGTDSKEDAKTSPHDLAYVVYTSGSTGEPKGVEISQENLLNLSQAMKEVYGRSAVLSVCRTGFDAFILESASAFLCGQTIVLASDMDSESPKRLAELIKSYGAGFLSMTPSRLAAYLREPAFQNVMRQVECIICGGEAFPVSLLNQLKVCTQARIYNQYGPSEAAVAVSMKRMNETDRITAGRPMANCRLYVLDEWMNPLPAGSFGELYIGGRCVGLGYRNDKAMTEEVFSENPFEKGERLYRTGDIACWTEEGEILLSGRIDFQIKLRGLRIEINEITACLKEYPGIREAAARVCSVRGQEMLTAYYTEKSDIQISEMKLRAHLAAYLPGYMVPDLLVCIEHMPYTANGKIDEKKLPLPKEETVSAMEKKGGSGSALAAWITEKFSEVLGQAEMTENSDYFLYGGNSLNAMEVLGELEELLGRKIRVSDLYACRTAANLAAYLETDERDYKVDADREGFRKAPESASYPLAPVQQGMYIQYRMQPENLAYHMPGAFRLGSSVDTERLGQILKDIVEQEPLFRTAFRMEENEVHAFVQKKVDFSVEELQAPDFQEAADKFLKPFVLEQAPLIRAAVWEESRESRILFLDSHHIIGDGMSTPILWKRLEEAYAAGSAGQVDWNYYDYLHNRQAGREETRQYWKQHFQTIPEPSKIPFDRNKNEPFDYKGEDYSYRITQDITQKMDAFGRENAVTPFMLLAAAWGVLQSRVCKQECLVIGTPVSGRLQPETREICGPFINTLPLILRPAENKCIKDYLGEVKDEVNGLLEHQDIALEELLEMLKLTRTLQGNALYQVMLAMRPFETSELKIAGETVEYIPVSTGSAKLDWALEVAKEHSCYQLRFEYSSRHERTTAAFYARTLEMLLEAVCGCSKVMTIGELPLMGAKDTYELFEKPMLLATPFLNLPVHRQIQNQIRITPNQTAVIWHDQKLTYAQLGEMADQFAWQFARAGLSKGDCVGLAGRRTPEIYAAILGILKNGCAYVPFLDSYPEKRIHYMLETAQARQLVCDEAVYQKLPGSLQKSAIVWRTGTSEEAFADRLVTGKDLLHVLFTSGSTGNPKGVMIEHHSMANLIQISREFYKEIEGPMIAATTITFDIFASEGLIPLALGKTIVLADEEEMLLPWKLAGLIDAWKGEFIQFTASRLQMCLQNDTFCEAAKGLKFTIVGGEAVPEELVSRFSSFCGGRLVNLYGPTEATVYTTGTDLKKGQVVTIGKPLSNYRVYILDSAGRPVMPTAEGEIYIAGQGVAAGYIGREELTEEAFLPDLYYPGEKMYRSGDAGRLKADGMLEYLGRLDGQIKMNGQRVETAEIEAVMRKSGLTRQAAVIGVKNPDGSTRLCGFYVADEDNRDKMQEALGTELPSYMIPASLEILPVLPLTEGGKTDRRRLAEYAAGKEKPYLEKTHSADPLMEPRVWEQQETSAEAKISFVWRRALGKTEIVRDVSFFEQGGTSLTALTALSQYFNVGLEMTMEEFYRNPTLKEQIVFFQQKDRKNRPRPEEHLETFPASVPPGERIKVKPERKILLTGATGFFGAHLLKELLEEGCGKIYCLIRGSREHLLSTLTWYFGERFTAARSRQLKTVEGCLEETYLGLGKERFQKLAGKCEAVYHCAADVRHYVSSEEEMYAVNVEGTKNIIRFALQGKMPLHHMSTVSVAGNRMKMAGSRNGSEASVFSEMDFDIGQDWQENVYVKSKFLGEAAVYRAMRENGLKAHVYRLGLLTQRKSDGVFQKNADTNAAWMLMQAARKLGVLPEKMCKQRTDDMPVDVCARMVRMLGYSKETVFHLIHPAPPVLLELMRKFVPEIKMVPDDVFEQLARALWKEADAQVLSPLLDRWNQLKKNGAGIFADSRRTQEELRKLGFDMEIWRKRDDI